VAVDWYGAVAFMGPIIGFFIVVGAIPLLIYSFCARNPRRAIIASRIALALSLISVLVSAILWLELLSGEYRYGDPLDYHDPNFMVFEVIAIFEALALLTSILSVVTQRASRMS
jgi:hypothetical protein